MTIPSSRSLILWISVFSITSPSADFGRLRKTSDFFGNDRVVSKNPSTPRIKISRLYLRKSWQVYMHSIQFAHTQLQTSFVTYLFIIANIPLAVSKHDFATRIITLKKARWLLRADIKSSNLHYILTLCI